MTTAPVPVATVPVALTTGQPLEVQTQEEATWFNATRDKYLKENVFTDVTDLQDLDQLLILELMVHRWSLWIASGRNYAGEIIDEGDFIKPLREYSTAIGQLKIRMTLTRGERERAEHESVGAYLVMLQRRAKEFGIHRQTQLGKALELMNQLSALLGAYDRADEEEREHIGLTKDSDILDWIREIMLPEFHEVDAHFRTHQQKYWAGTL